MWSSRLILVGIGRAAGMNNDFTQAILGRPVPIYGHNHQTRWLTVVFDLQTQQIVGVEEDWLKDEYVHQALEFLGKIDGSKPYYVGMSHSEQYAAALQLELDGRSQVIIARSRGHVERFPSTLVVDQMELEMYVGHPTDPRRLHWSHDDSLVFYSSFDGSCWKFDVETGQETMLREDRTIISSSPLSPMVVAKRSNAQKNNYYVLHYMGKETWFAEGADLLKVLRWTDSDRFVYSLEDKCFAYDISAGESTFISTGVAFDYDAATNRVFIHDQVK